MNAISSIFVIVDPTAQVHPAVTKGAALAARLNARLDLYLCETRALREARLARRLTHTPADSQSSPETFLDRLAEPLRKQGLEVTTEIDFADTLGERLMQKIAQTTASLVVKDTHHHSLLRRSFLSNTDWQLIRACPCTLLLTKPGGWRSNPRIVAAVDPGHVDDKPALLDNVILQNAACVTKALEGELHVLHAFVPTIVIAAALSTDPAAALAVTDDDVDLERNRKRQAIVELATEFGIASDRIHIEFGGPAQVLPHAAHELKADILVMGALARRGVRRAVIGSTAEEVLERLPCDALIIKPPDFAGALSGLCPDL